MAIYSKKIIIKLLNQSDTVGTADEKGAKLEELMCYIFEKIPGVSFIEKNILDTPRAHEIDIAFWNLQNKSDISFLDSVIIIECKNTSTPIGSMDVGWFVRKLQDRGSNHGILVSLSGITGASNGISNAHSEILNALTRDRIKIILITRDEILNLIRTQDLVKLMINKILSLTLHRTVN
ncbi:MAG: restriction endonuclease [bacterium]|nr:restriction endonuclease [bacterium]